MGKIKLLLGASILLVSGQVNAASLVLADAFGSELQGANGVIVNGITYNVERSGPRLLDSSLRSYFPRHQAASGKLMDS